MLKKIRKPILILSLCLIVITSNVNVVKANSDNIFPKSDYPEISLRSTTIHKALSVYFYDVTWINRKQGVSLQIKPKPVLTGGNRFKAQDHAWSILRSAYSYDLRWNNEESLKKQFFCHVRYGSLKTPWNIEPWKKSTSFITCN